MDSTFTFRIDLSENSSGGSLKVRNPILPSFEVLSSVLLSGLGLMSASSSAKSDKICRTLVPRHHSLAQTSVCAETEASAILPAHQN